MGVSEDRSTVDADPTVDAFETWFRDNGAPGLASDRLPPATGRQSPSESSYIFLLASGTYVRYTHFMTTTAPSVIAVNGALVDAVDLLAQLLPDDLEAGEGSRLLVQLTTISNRLSGEIARVAAHVSETGEWASSGATSMAAFLSNATGMAWGAAKGTVELGDAMATTPALDDAVRSGALTPANAATVLPVLDDDGFADVASDLIGELVGMTPTKATRHLDAWRAVTNPADDAERRNRARKGRKLKFRALGDGMTRIAGDVPDSVAHALRRILKHLADQQRTDGTDRTGDQRRVDALGDLAAAYERGEVRGGRNLPRLIATMTLDDLETRTGFAVDSAGNVLTSTEIDQLCCDGTIHRYVADQTGAILNFGRGRRTISPQQFLALVARDGGCRHPGCDRPPEWCEGHHLREFAARGGLTDLDEMILLCHHHHHDLHDSSTTMNGTPQHLVFTRPTGERLHSTLPRHATTTAA